MAEAESWRRCRSSMVGRGGRGRAGINAGETPALPGGSRPHALSLRAAQFSCDIAPGRPAGGNGSGMAEAESWRRCRSSMVGRGGRGRAGINAGETPALPGGSRPRALPYRAAQFSCDIAPGRPACGSGSGMAEAESWRRCRSSMVGRGGRGRAGINAGETPALPGGSRPHALPYRAAQFSCDIAPGRPACGSGRGMTEAESWRRCRSSMVGRGGRGRAGINAGETPALPGGSRPHALPYRAAQFSCDIAPGRPACGNCSGMTEAESWRRCRSSMVGRGGRGRAGINAGETPALPGGSRPHALPYRAAQFSL